MRFSLTRAVRSFILYLPSTTPTHISAIYEEVNSPGNLSSETSPAPTYFFRHCSKKTLLNTVGRPSFFQLPKTTMRNSVRPVAFITQHITPLYPWSYFFPTPEDTMYFVYFNGLDGPDISHSTHPRCLVSPTAFCFWFPTRVFLRVQIPSLCFAPDPTQRTTRIYDQSLENSPPHSIVHHRFEARVTPSPRLPEERGTGPQISKPESLGPGHPIQNTLVLD